MLTCVNNLLRLRLPFPIYVSCALAPCNSTARLAPCNASTISKRFEDLMAANDAADEELEVKGWVQ